MNHVMLDLETMGNGPSAAIVAIGAVRFGDGVTGDEFYERVNLESSLAIGLKMDASTVLWWMQQSDAARAELYRRDGCPIELALEKFAAWLPPLDAQVWGNGASFDNVILNTAYRFAGKEGPWKFWNDRCYRTIKALHPHIKVEQRGTHHHALDDARSQARHLMQILPAL